MSNEIDSFQRSAAIFTALRRAGAETGFRAEAVRAVSKPEIWAKWLCRLESVIGQGPLKDARRTVEAARALGIEAVPIDAPEFPTLLAHIPDPPLVLWVKGHLGALHLPTVAMVGTRRASSYGKATASAIAQALAASGVSVVSGLAFGIDAASHQGALAGVDLATGSAGVAVLASGVAVVTPSSHERLAARLLELGGALVSEVEPDCPAQPHLFLARNRIISGLSRATIVVEAPIRSGALSTARHAADQGRDVFAVPGRIDSSSSSGTNALLADGAQPCLGIQELLSRLGFAKEAVKARRRPSLAAGAARLLELIEREREAQIEDLIGRLDLDPSEALRHIGFLELEGLIERTGAGSVAATRPR